MNQSGMNVLQLAILNRLGQMQRRFRRQIDLITQHEKAVQEVCELAYQETHYKAFLDCFSSLQKQAERARLELQRHADSIAPNSYFKAVSQDEERRVYCCPDCRCKFSIQIEPESEVDIDDALGYTETPQIVNCPACKACCVCVATPNSSAIVARLIQLEKANRAPSCDD